MKYNLKPKFKTELKTMCNVIVEIDNPYLQAWSDAGAYVMSHGGDYWIMTDIGQLWFKILEDKMHLECIAVVDTDRRQGNGGKLMGYITQLADETNTTLSLEVSIVTRGNYMGVVHPTVALGAAKLNKIPVRSLPKWYEKHGFKKTPQYTEKKRKMIYTPKK